MSRTRWEQIKRVLKISNSVEDRKHDSRGVDWTKKLEPLATVFRRAAKTYWLPGSHASIDEQLVMFKGTSRHVLQIASKTAEVGF